MVVEVCGRGAADKRNKKRGIASCSVLSRGTMSQCSLETSYKATQCDASVCLLHPTERLRRKVWRRLGNWNRSVYSTSHSEFLDAYSGSNRHKSHVYNMQHDPRRPVEALVTWLLMVRQPQHLRQHHTKSPPYSVSSLRYCLLSHY